MHHAPCLTSAALCAGAEHWTQQVHSLAGGEELWDLVLPQLRAPVQLRPAGSCLPHKLLRQRQRQPHLPIRSLPLLLLHILTASCLPVTVPAM